MTLSQLSALYRDAHENLSALRACAEFTEPELEDSPELRAEARRFAQRLACAPDAATVQLDLLADHAGAQAFQALLRMHWDATELMLNPAAFELLPNPMPFEPLAVCFLAMLETAQPVAAAPEPMAGEASVSSLQGESSDADVLRLSPRVGKGEAGAVWEFTDVY